ncbi:MAG TPA: sigma-70 family RNA polymerase sigma factor [Polyangia bacterium]|jgi:RNA polymerase sigma-70 factor (ECF subfamily)|nr:sigma-70 family RNA polymerase sigma factor [Polyangia bacterium]
MTDVGSVFLSELRDRHVSLAPFVDPVALQAGLVEILGAAHAVGAEAWAPIQLGREEFVRHLAGCVARTANPGDAAAALKTLHLTDLYLACAAGLGVAQARERFVSQFLLPIESAVRAIGNSAGFVEDVRQEIHERLLLPSSGPPKILQYGGRAALASWVGVAARRAALQVLRERGARQRLAQDTADEELGVQLDPELEYVKNRYREAFKVAVSGAIAALSTRERMILRLHCVGGLSLARIATMLAVDESTVSRWEKRARETIFGGTNVRLSENLGVAHDDLPSLVRLVSSQLQLSVARLLASDAEGARPRSK